MRDVVDSRRNIGSLFLAVAGVALIGTFVPSTLLRSYASFLLFGFFMLLIVDSFVLGRLIKRKIAERFLTERRSPAASSGTGSRGPR